MKFCFISDHPVIPIEQLRVCAALAVREGLDEETALAALTSIPASLLKLDDELGSIQVGKRADLLILNAHPFDFCSRVERYLWMAFYGGVCMNKGDLYTVYVDGAVMTVCVLGSYVEELSGEEMVVLAIINQENMVHVPIEDLNTLFPHKHYLN